MGRRRRHPRKGTISTVCECANLVLLDDLDRVHASLGEDEDDQEEMLDEGEGDEEGAEDGGEDVFDEEPEEEEEDEEEEDEEDEDEEEKDEVGDEVPSEDDLGDDLDDLNDTLDRPPSDAESAAPAPQSASAGPAQTKYIPPAMRAAMAKDRDEAHALQQQKLRRHVNGLLNRLGEGNVDTILGELEGLYRTYARGDVTSMLATLVLDTVAARTQLSETIVVLYAVLLTAMHRVVGVEFGAFFLQTCMSRFLDVYKKLLSSPDAGEEDTSAWSRECVNLVLLMCHLFNHKLLSAGIIYDLVRLLLGCDFSEMLPPQPGGKRIHEVDIELVLRIVQSCGQQLRRDDAASLKAIAELTKQRLDEAQGGADLVADSSRARFMLETLQDPRQNKKHANTSSADSAQRLGKYLSTLERRRTLRTHTALQVGLRDLQDAETKGRWWLVGAAWTGHEPTHGAPEAEAPLAAAQDAAWLPDDASASGVDVGSLARTQGMNTDARRSVFTTLMTALDYKEAVQNLMQLKLNEVQRREIIRVLVHCVGSEQQYNPYYVLIGQALAEDHPGMRITLQYVLWDYFREIGEKHVGGETMAAQLDEEALPDAGESRSSHKLAHLARAYGTWIGHGALSLIILRPVDFVSLQANGVRFLQQLFVYTLLATQTKAPMLTDAVRSRLAQPASKADRSAVERVLVKGTVGQPTLAQGLLVFLRQHLRKRDVAAVLGAEEPVLPRVQWAVKVALETVNVGATSAEA